MKQKRNWLSSAVCLALILVMLLLPTGYENAGAGRIASEERVRARILSTDDSTIKDTGLVRSGEQSCEVLLLGGSHRGETYRAYNMLNGSLEQDKVYQTGESALVLVSLDGASVASVSMIDHYRIAGEIWLLLAFFALLMLFAGWTGLRAVLSFVLSVLAIWKVLVPLCLNGMNPIFVGAVVTGGLTILIIALVFGFNKITLAACTGAIAGLIVTAALGIVCTNAFRIHGAVMSFSESLLYSGYETLNLTQIFMASIFIGSSGAMMDLSVDIAAAVNEVVHKRPDLSRFEAMMSGMRVGRAAMGTMTTTLLLAYSGSYIALLMVFMAQGTPMINVFNYKYVASEIIHTIVGSFGLVAAAPLTAAAAGFFLVKPEREESKPVPASER
ncbi:MAG: YibE/F family protein [Clostridiales bacterium]|nr:YibE/F family protein [Clostridiales bacterium]